MLPLEPLNSCSISPRLDLYRQTSLISVPFNPAVASRYYNDTIQFHTTLSYLKSPPPGYQQPATDILKGLQDIQNGIDRGLFPNQYAFEANLQSLIQSAHDVHFRLDADILAAFDFESPYSIVSLSEDGIQDPKTYLTGNFPSSLGCLPY